MNDDYVAQWPETDECPISGERSPGCEMCHETDCARGEHILAHRAYFYAPLGWMDGQGYALKYVLGYGDYLDQKQYTIAKVATEAMWKATGDDGAVD